MGGSLAWMYYLYIIKHPGKALSRDQIMKVFLVETPVYYDDGESLMGVFLMTTPTPTMPVSESLMGWMRRY